VNFFHHKDLGNHLLQLCPKVVKHPVYYVFVLKILIFYASNSVPTLVVCYATSVLKDISWTVAVTVHTEWTELRLGEHRA
jgi:hypothetical protein